MPNWHKKPLTQRIKATLLEKYFVSTMLRNRSAPSGAHDGLYCLKVNQNKKQESIDDKQISLDTDSQFSVHLLYNYMKITDRGFACNQRYRFLVWRWWYYVAMATGFWKELLLWQVIQRVNSWPIATSALIYSAIIRCFARRPMRSIQADANGVDSEEKHSDKNDSRRRTQLLQWTGIPRPATVGLFSIRAAHHCLQWIAKD